MKAANKTAASFTKRTKNDHQRGSLASKRTFIDLSPSELEGRLVAFLASELEKAPLDSQLLTDLILWDRAPAGVAADRDRDVLRESGVVASSTGTSSPEPNSASGSPERPDPRATPQNPTETASEISTGVTSVPRRPKR